MDTPRGANVFICLKQGANNFNLYTAVFASATSIYLASLKSRIEYLSGAGYGLTQQKRPLTWYLCLCLEIECLHSLF